MTDQNTKFINSLFLKNLIENQFGEFNVQIKKFTVEAASGGNELYCTKSSMNRVFVRYSSQEFTDNTLCIVLKIKPVTGKLSEQFKKSDLFEKETQIYKNILPHMIELLKQRDGKIELAPDLIYSCEVPSDILIFEDLTNRGYTTEDPKLGLNFQQSKMAIEKLALFHAASVILINDNTNTIDLSVFKRGTFHETHQNNGLKYFTDLFNVFIELSSEIGIESRITEKLKTLPSKLIQKGINDYTSNINDFNVLNHGDFWTGNILFKYTCNSLVDVIFLDFQNSVIGSPIIDLLFFLTTSVAYDVLELRRDELIFSYHQILTYFLIKLKYNKYIPSLNELQIALLRHGALEVIYAVTTSPYLRTPNNHIHPAIQPVLYQEITPQNDLKENAASILKKHQAILQLQLKKYDSIGLLDWGTAQSKVKGLLGRFQK